MTVNQDGSAIEQITFNEDDDVYPVWSPDGTKVLFVSNADGDNEIMTINADGTDLTQITFNEWSDSYPHWSPAGTRIFYLSNQEGNYNLYVMDADGSNSNRVYSDNVDANGRDCDVWP